MNQPVETPQPRFATVYGTPGQSPRILGPLRVFWPLAPICMVAGWLLHAALPFPKLSTSQAGLLFILLAGVLAFFTSWSARRLKSFLKGADGEEKVARSLAFLPASHTVFNDFQFQSGEPTFDHIIVAPIGIFVIETKNWSGEITFEKGKVLYNGEPPSRSPLKQVKEATAILLDHLSEANCPEIPVHPVVCFVDNPPQGGLSNVGGVRICTVADLHGLFENAVEPPLPAGTLNMVTKELIRFTEME